MKRSMQKRCEDNEKMHEEIDREKGRAQCLETCSNAIDFDTVQYSKTFGRSIKKCK